MKLKNRNDAVRIKSPIFIILAILTLYPSLMLDRYQDAGKELLQNPDCLNSCQFWTVHSPEGASIHNENGIVTLESTGNGKTVQIRQTVVPAGERIRLQAELTCDGVVPGEKPWNQARLIITQHTAEGKSITSAAHLYHQEASLSGTHGWHSYALIVPVSPETRELRILAQLSRCTGTLSLRNISLKPVTQALWYAPVRMGVLGAWSIYIVYLFLSLGKSTAPGFGRPVFLTGISLGLLLLIVVGVTMPMAVKTNVTHVVERDINHLISMWNSVADGNLTGTSSGISIPLLTLNIAKIGHFTLFTLFAFFLVRMMPATSRFELILTLLLFAGATELMQLYIDDRTSDIRDVVVDLFGILAGVSMRAILGSGFAYCGYEG